MTVDMPEYLSCSPEFIGGLIETVSVALLDNFPNTHVDLFDIEQVIDALKLLRPRAVEIETLDGLMCMTKGQWLEANQVLLRVIEMRPQFGYVKALLAFSLSSIGDPSWRQIAAEALADDPNNKVTRALVGALEIKEEMNRSIREHRSVQPFAPLASLEKASASSDEPDNDVQQDSAPAAQMFYGGTFLRA
ncbi:HrpB1 family type III secretion system apparatus protein [Burkholderia cepacia]|uniref:HrpB1 family type III secretion system apparatus protein n=1 Tax=Burkholderia cepacia TaxID=292 RepID=UPI00158F612F|nr:HrpB1 family type III secretion system apparatus protein [Burkholderia cepacia]